MSYSPLERNSDRGQSSSSRSLFNGSTNGRSRKNINDHDDDDDDDEIDYHDDTASRRSRLSQFRKPTPLSEPLTALGSAEGGFDERDPYYVFRDDLQRKLTTVDESLAEFLRIIHQTVRA
jgi:hypothetical protein